MRERPVPCKNSTLREFVAGRHRTFNDSGVCHRCAAPGLARDWGQGAPPHPAPTPLTAAERAARNAATAAAVERVLDVSALDWPVQAPQAPRPVR